MRAWTLAACTRRAATMCARACVSGASRHRDTNAFSDDAHRVSGAATKARAYESVMYVYKMLVVTLANVR